MPKSEIKEIERVNSGVDQDGAYVKEKSSLIESKTSSKTVLTNLIWFIYGLVAILLGIRLIFKLTGANSGSGFVSIIYSTSKVLSAPFDSIFGVKTAQAGATRSVFEPSIIIAIVVYALIAWGIVKLISINQNR